MTKKKKNKYNHYTENKRDDTGSELSQAAQPQRFYERLSDGMARAGEVDRDKYAINL